MDESIIDRVFAEISNGGSENPWFHDDPAVLQFLHVVVVVLGISESDPFP